MPLFAGEFWVTLAHPDHDLRAARAFGRLAARPCRPVLALPCGVLRGRRLHDCDPAGALWRARRRLPRPPASWPARCWRSVFAFAVRTRGVYFILITLAFGYIIWGVAYRWASFTGGDNGVTNVPFPAIGTLRVTNATQYYYVVLVAVVLCGLAYRLLVTSPFGLDASRHQVERIAHAQPRLRRRPASLRGVRAVGDHRQHRRRALCLLQPLHQSGRARRFRSRSKPC